MRYTMCILEQAGEEHPVAYDSTGNSDAETAVKRITGIMRTNKLDVEARVKGTIPITHPLMSWLAEFSAWICNVVKTGDDGKTAYHRARGRPYTKRLICFGEKVLVHLPTKGAEANERGKLD